MSGDFAEESGDIGILAIEVEMSATKLPLLQQIGAACQIRDPWLLPAQPRSQLPGEPLPEGPRPRPGVLSSRGWWTRCGSQAGSSQPIANSCRRWVFSVSGDQARLPNGKSGTRRRPDSDHRGGRRRRFADVGIVAVLLSVTPGSWVHIALIEYRLALDLHAIR